MRYAIWILGLTVLGWPAANGAMGQKTEEKPPLTTASGVFRIVCDPASGLTQRPSSGVVQSSLLEKVLYGVEFKKAIEAVSPDAAKADPQVIRFQNADVVLVSPGEARFEISVQSFDERVPAEKLMAALRAVVSAELAKLDTRYQVDAHRVDLLREQLAKSSEELAKQKYACRALAQLHKVPATPEIAAQQRARLDAQIESASVELEGLEARHHALEAQISEVGKKAAESAAGDPVVAELEKAVAFRAEIVERMRINKASTVEILAAESQLAEHKAELAKFRREAAQAAGGTRLVELRRRFEDTAIEEAEATAKRKALVEMRDSIGFSAELDLKRLEVERLESSYREVGRELDELTRKLNLYQPPEVTLILTQ